MHKGKFIAPDALLLVVDDNRMNLVVFESLLKTTKVKIETADSGEEDTDFDKPVADDAVGQYDYEGMLAALNNEKGGF